MVGTSQTILVAGFMVGAFVISPVMDKVGRKRVALTCVILVSILGFCNGWVKHYWLFCIFRFVLGFIQQVNPHLILEISSVILNDRIRSTRNVIRKHWLPEKLQRAYSNICQSCPCGWYCIVGFTDNSLGTPQSFVSE